MFSQAEIKSQLPQHLQQFVADQDYDTRYSPRDQAVWRYVMRQLTNQLETSAHPVYFEGLKRTGIRLDHIPSIDEMNQALAKLGWRAIVVDGFIPPQAFMELQALKVLAIALDMRSVHHIEYTPAPDIIHEAAGHAPIIADEEYSDYLQRFGEVGMQAIYNRYDLDLYNAVRTLSIVKEAGSADDIKAAEARLDTLLANPGKPSELALLTRLHWWTVEYGLVGTPEDYKIFGAGLLSSLGESLSCLQDSVKKLPLTTSAISQGYDITSTQPQLYVTKSCRHLTQVLEEFASTMCYQRGGAEAVQTAIEAGVVTTCEYSSGLQVSGKFSRLLRNAIGTEIYIGTEGPTQLALDREELPGHGIDSHHEGFGSPVGRICNLMKPLEAASEYDLQAMGIKRDQEVTLEFLSGVTVRGHLDSITKDHGTLLLFSFSGCTVTGPKGELLFDPAWGRYDMAVGEKIRSVFAGSADITRFNVYPSRPEDEVRPAIARPDPSLMALYDAAAHTADNEAAEAIAEQALAEHPGEWLLQVELLDHLAADSPWRHTLVNHLATQAWDPETKRLVDRALDLLPGDRHAA